MRMKNLFTGSLISIVLAFASVSTTFAAKPTTGGTKTTTSSLGNDVSYPQCSSTLPTGQAFGIVGVNGGIASTSNSCFTTELTWAQQSTGVTAQPKAMLYVNTANPGHASAVWPTSNDVYGTNVTSVYGTCDGSESAACAYVYGWARAYDDANSRNVPNPSTYKWWLDVETANSWSSTNLQANDASLEGMTDYFKSIGATVGIYSTAYQWGVIAGTPSATSSLNGLDSWLPGALTQNGAVSNCQKAPLTVGGKVTMTQFTSKNIDYDVSCI